MQWSYSKPGSPSSAAIHGFKPPNPHIRKLRENTSLLWHNSTNTYYTLIGTTEAHSRIACTLCTTPSSRSHRIHSIDSIHIVQALSHPRYRLDPHRPGLIASTLSTRSIYRPGLIASTLSTRSTSSRPYRIHAIDSIHVVQVSMSRIHTIDSIHII